MRNNDATYTELLKIRDRLDREQTELQRRMDEINKNLESVSRTLELLDHTADESVTETDTHSASSRISGGTIDIASLRGMTQLQALEKIAQQGGGTLRTPTAKRLFLQAGLIKNVKNANNIIFSVIHRSGVFERVDRGVYRLIGHPVRPVRSSEHENA